MNGIIPYLTFAGNARDAMSFYHRALGGDLTMQTFAEAKMGDGPGVGDLIVHARIVDGPAILMASDAMPGHPYVAGTNFSVSIGCTSNEEIDRFFAALAEGGQVTMPVQDTFWGARFGMLTDRFGINWMLNYEKPTS